MVYIYLLAAYCHLNLDVTKENLLVVGFSAVPAVFLVVFEFGICTEFVSSLSGGASLLPILIQEERRAFFLYCGHNLVYMFLHWFFIFMCGQVYTRVS